MGAALEITGLTLRFGGVTALDHISLSLTAGSVLGIAGPNGSGKSSLINVLTGHYPAQGTMRLNGHPIEDLSPARRAQLGITRTFQAPRLYRRMTVLENLHAACHAQRSLFQGQATRRRDKENAADSLARFGLGALADAMPDRLTPFEQRLLELARAHVSGARLLLLDEPAAGATEDEARNLADVMAKHLIPGRSVILIEHRMDVLRALCTELAVLDAGRLLANGPVDTVLASHAVRARLMGEIGDA